MLIFFEFLPFFRCLKLLLKIPMSELTLFMIKLFVLQFQRRLHTSYCYPKNSSEQSFLPGVIIQQWVYILIHPSATATLMIWPYSSRDWA